MNRKTYRAPLALALAALFAASLAPVSGADARTTLYTFDTGAGEPKWTILKLEVTKPGIEPFVEFRTDEFRCPSYWAIKFYQGTPANASVYNGFGIMTAVGRHGADTYITTPVGTSHTDDMTHDGEESCLWFDFNVDFGELPLGTVYVLHMAVGVPFEGSATLLADPSGVQVVGMSSGASGFFYSETVLGNGQGIVAHGPPFCGGPTEVLDCPADHYNPGGHVGAAVEIGQRKLVNFKHHPWLRVTPRGSAVLANASVEIPDGRVEYLHHGDARVGDLEVNPGEISINDMGYPPGRYMVNVHKGVHVGALSYSGWHIVGADLRFPEEVA